MLGISMRSENPRHGCWRYRRSTIPEMTVEDSRVISNSSLVIPVKKPRRSRQKCPWQSSGIASLIIPHY